MIWFPNFLGKYIDIRQTEFSNLGTQEERDVDYPVFWNLIAMCLVGVLLHSFFSSQLCMYAPVRILLKQRYDNMTKKLLELFQEDVSTICSILMNFLISCCGKQKLIATSKRWIFLQQHQENSLSYCLSWVEYFVCSPIYSLDWGIVKPWEIQVSLPSL